MRWLREVYVLPIRGYQRWISPITPPACRFTPSCSEYGLQVILAHGIIKGTLLTAWRILRCQPLCEGGHDPIPTPGRWRSERTQAEPED